MGTIFEPVKEEIRIESHSHLTARNWRGVLTLSADSKDIYKTLSVSFLQSFPRLDEGARVLMNF